MTMNILASNALVLNTFRGEAQGLDFDYARRIAADLGIDPGAGVTVALFDEGWDLTHAAFRRETAGSPDFTYIGEGPIGRGRDEHGTAVLGLFVGEDPAVAGANALLPGARFLLIQALDTETRPSTALLDKAIDMLATTSPAVLLIARDWSSRAPHLPYELKPGVASILAKATRTGIVVVEAAGNGGVDLDALGCRDGADVHGQITMANDPWIAADDRFAPVFQIDTGALVVGACTSCLPFRRWTGGFPHNPQPRSNFGSRITCWAPGENLFTASGNSAFNSGFGGTSGASAIIAAAVSVVQSLAMATSPTRSPLPVSQIRALFGAYSNGRPVFSEEELIGSMPDLRKIVDELLGR